jgi:hypothetical protein
MPDNPLRTRFRNVVCAAIAEGLAASDFEHPGLTGTSREIVVEKLLRPALPPEIALGGGKLVDSEGRLSSQIDVVVYSPQIMPPFLHDARTGLFPYECCLYAIEVKSQLTKTVLKEAVANARALKSLKAIRTQFWAGWQSATSPTPAPISALFAFKSDLAGSLQDELDRYRSCDEDENTSPAIGVMCIVGKGYCYHKADSWGTFPPTERYDEVLAFLAGVSNTIPQFVAAKGRPRFGNYLVDEPQNTVPPEESPE